MQNHTVSSVTFYISVLPSVGISALSTGEKEPHKLLQPADKTLRAMAIKFAEYQVFVDVFITTQSYVGIASISISPRTTKGQVVIHDICHPLPLST
ncbi:transport protein Sec24-like protein [Tanacetum coccineum]